MSKTVTRNNPYNIYHLEDRAITSASSALLWMPHLIPRRSYGL